jgi:hypothetical protein
MTAWKIRLKRIAAPESQIRLQHNTLSVCWFSHRYSWVGGNMRIMMASRPSRPPTYWLRIKEGGSSNDN